MPYTFAIANPRPKKNQPKNSVPLFEKEGLGEILLDKSPSAPSLCSPLFSKREVNTYDLEASTSSLAKAGASVSPRVSGKAFGEFGGALGDFHGWALRLINLR